jgi:hypothetical protein
MLGVYTKVSGLILIFHLRTCAPFQAMKAFRGVEIWVQSLVT